MSYIVEILEKSNNESVSLNNVAKMFEKNDLVLKRLNLKNIYLQFRIWQWD